MARPGRRSPLPALPANTTALYRGVSCVSVVFCVAVGSVDFDESASPIHWLEQWNGGSWTIVVDSTTHRPCRGRSTACPA